MEDYNRLQAFQAAKLWEPFNLYWLEEPVSPNQIDCLADLRSRTSMPIAAGENEFRVYGFKHLFDKNAVDVAMPDIGRAGGIQEVRNICALAQSYGDSGISPQLFLRSFVGRNNTIDGQHTQCPSFGNRHLR